MSEALRRSPMNYTGGKFKLLPQLLPLFPADVHTFVDLFAGGLDVSMNMRAQRYVCNDLNAPLTRLYEEVKARGFASTQRHIARRVSKYALTKENEAGYLALRKHYNRYGHPLDLFVLAAFSFNHQLRFSQSGTFNAPFGRDRSAYNPRMKDGLAHLAHFLGRGSVAVSTSDFRSLKAVGKCKTGDFVYADPPYLISTGTYNDGKRGYGGWGDAEESALLNSLDALDRRGVTFGLSNVLVHKGAENRDLIEWAQKYQIHPIAANYNNSNYQSRAKESVTQEVYITNLIQPVV